MTPETLKRLEELYDKWANEAGTGYIYAEEVMDHLPDLIAAVKERDAFAANMDYSIRLGIATATEQLQKELDVANKRLKVCAEDRDAAAAERDALQERITGMEGELEDAHAKVEVMRGERDAALKACAQKDEALQFCSQFPLGEDLHYKVCAALDDNTCGKGWVPQSELDTANAKCAEMRDVINMLWNPPYENPAMLNKVNHAISSDCGKDYIKAESLRCFKCSDGHTPLYCLNCAREGYHHEREVERLIPYLRHGDKCTPGQTEMDADKCQCGLMTILAGLGFSKDGFKLDNPVQTVALSSPGRKEIKSPPANSTAAEHATGRTDASPNEPVTQSPAGEPAVKHPVGCGLTFTAEEILPLVEALKPFAACNPLRFGNMPPEKTWLWKPSQTHADPPGISVAHIESANHALAQWEKVKEAK